MLQWMGGSRRKVVTSTRSTHKRQKQYFQQKKRQQQTAGQDHDADGVICIQFLEKPKSLDILSLLNLAKVAQECKSGRTNESESREINSSPGNYQVSRCPSTGLIPSNDSSFVKEAGTESPTFAVENVSPKNFFCRSPVDIPCSRNYSSNRGGDNPDHQKKETECEISVFDLLGDDELNGNSDGNPIHEAHAAFSVEGLGKLGIGTPAHSPQRPGRVFSNGYTMPRKPARKYQSSRNCNYSMKDIELELNTLIPDVNMPLPGNSLDLPFRPSGVGDCFSPLKSTKLPGKGGTPLGSPGGQMNNFFDNEECPYSGINNEQPWKTRPHFLHDNCPVDSDMALEDQSYNMGASCVDFLRNNTYTETDFAFEDSYWRKERDLAEIQKDFDTSEHLTSEKDQESIALTAPRYPTVDGRWNFDSSTWSNFAVENANDNLSFFSKMSCSSTAVMGETTNYSVSNFGKRRETLRYGSELLRKDATRNHFAEDIWYEDVDKIHRGTNLTGSSKYTSMLRPSPSRSRSQPTELSHMLKELESECWLLEEGDVFVDTDAGSHSSQRKEESNLASLERKSWSEKRLGSFQTSDISSEMCPSTKKSRLDANCTSYNNFFTESIACPQSFSSMDLYDPPIFTNTESKSRKPITSRASKTEDDRSHSSQASGFPVFSGKAYCTTDGEDKPESQPPDRESFPSDLKTEVLDENTLVLTESGNTVEGPGSKDGSCEQLVEKPIRIDSSGLEQEVSSRTKDVTGKLELYIDDEKYQTESPKHSPSQSGTKGKEESLPMERKIEKDLNHNNEPSYQVMLESYVFQLLCVQKVPEASEHNSSKKV